MKNKKILLLLSLVAVGVLVGVYFLYPIPAPSSAVASAGGKEAETLEKEEIAMMDDLSTTLEKLTDKASANAAARRISKITDREKIRWIQAEEKKQGLSLKAQAAFIRKYEKRRNNAAAKFERACEKAGSAHFYGSESLPLALYRLRLALANLPPAPILVFSDGSRTKAPIVVPAGAIRKEAEKLVREGISHLNGLSGTLETVTDKASADAAAAVIAKKIPVTRYITILNNKLGQPFPDVEEELLRKSREERKRFEESLEKIGAVNFHGSESLPAVLYHQYMAMGEGGSLPSFLHKAAEKSSVLRKEVAHLANTSITVMNELSGTLEKVTDKASADAAAPKISGKVYWIKAIQDRVRKIHSVQDFLTPEKAEQLKEANIKLDQAVRKVEKANAKFDQATRTIDLTAKYYGSASLGKAISSLYEVISHP